MDDEELWTHDGRHVGKLQGSDIFNSQALYIGELMNGHRLITNDAKRSWQGGSFTPYGKRGGYAPYANYAGYAMYAGYSEFLHPDEFYHITNSLGLLRPSNGRPGRAPLMQSVSFHIVNGI